MPQIRKTLPKEDMNSNNYFYEDEYLDKDEDDLVGDFGTLPGQQKASLTLIEDSADLMPDDKKLSEGADDMPDRTSPSPDKQSSSKKSIGDKTPKADEE
jgi:hypothetical protein